nr:carboxypeptidase regulatory-like domain-containing protein [Bacteroidota bacterium]
MKTIKYIFRFLIIITLLHGNAVMLMAQSGQSNNYIITQGALLSTGIVPSQNVTGTDYRLQEGMSGDYACRSVQSNQYLHFPGMIFPEDGPPAYCTGNLYSSGCIYGDGIESFILGDIENLNTGCSPEGFGDYTALSTTLTTGSTPLVEIASQYSQQWVCIWIDWDDDYTFTAEEQILTDAVIVDANTLFTFECLIPQGVPTGAHRMRVRTNWGNSSADPCTTYQFGEAEDYTVNLVEGLPAGAIEGFITSIDSGEPVEGVQVSAENTDFETLSGPDGYYLLDNLPTGNYVLLLNADGYLPFTSEPVLVEAGVTAIFDIQLITESGYCTTNLYAYGCTFGDGINDFALQDIQNPGSGCSENGYGDFTALSTTITAGGTAILEISSEYDAQYLSIWIDLDDDFLFEDSERLLADLFMINAGIIYNTELNIPQDAPLGSHRLRARTNYGFTCDDPCGLYSYGEAEDYTVIIEVPVPEIQEIILTEGWSGISSYLIPDEPGIEILFQDILNDIVILQNSAGVFWPSQMINTLGAWDYTAGYQVKVANDAMLTITGFPADPPEIWLTPGWSLMPILSECNVSTEALFAEYSDDLILLKEVAGTGVYWPEFGMNTAPVLVPGKCYFVCMANDAAIQFDACQNKSSFTFQNHKPGPSPWGFAVQSPKTHVVALPGGLFAESDQNTTIGAFTNEGILAGVAVLSGENTVITIFGDDPTTAQKDGFDEDEPIRFRVRKNDEHLDREIVAEYDPAYSDNEGRFHGNGLSMISGLKMPQLSAFYSEPIRPVIYPNPASDRIYIRTKTPVNNLTIIDITGREIKSIKINNQKIFSISIQDIPDGIYAIILNDEKHVFSQKIIKRNSY